jgi:hypothetical protein
MPCSEVAFILYTDDIPGIFVRIYRWCHTLVITDYTLPFKFILCSFSPLLVHLHCTASLISYNMSVNSYERRSRSAALVEQPFFCAL